MFPGKIATIINNSNMDYSNRNTLITGGSSGIGLAVARLLASRGANVWIMARRPEKLEVALAELEGLRRDPGQILETFAIDVSDPIRVEQAIASIVEKAAAPELVVHSAGDVQPGYVHQLSDTDYRVLIGSHYLGGVYVSKAVLPYMLANKSGHFVFLSSVLGRIGVLGYSAYGPAKAAMVLFADALRMEVKPHGIHVTVVYPSDTDTPQLAYDNAHIPDEIKYLKGIFNSHIISPDTVAHAILDGVERKREVIIPDLDGRLMDLILKLAGRGATTIVEYLIAHGYRRNYRFKNEPKND
jgi:3-dehydrosphinganine reductase